MHQDIAKYIQAYTVYQQHKYLASNPIGLLQPIRLPTKVWDEVTMDFIERLPHSERVNTIMVIVDRLSKYTHFIALRHSFTAISVAVFVFKEIVCLHGILQSIISDED